MLRRAEQKLHAYASLLAMRRRYGDEMVQSDAVITERRPVAVICGCNVCDAQRCNSLTRFFLFYVT